MPSLVERNACAAVLFVDALLPHPGRSWVDGAPADLVTALRGMVGPDGLLPPWDTWFGPAALAELLPEAGQRALVASDVPRVPLAYLEAVAPVHRAWEAVPCGYLRLSGAYEREAGEAEARGWPVECLAGQHLSAVSDPEAVADAVLVLTGRVLRR